MTFYISKLHETIDSDIKLEIINDPIDLDEIEEKCYFFTSLL